MISMKTKIRQIWSGLAAVNQKPAPRPGVMITAYSESIRVTQSSAANMLVVYIEYWYFKESRECGRICHLEYGSWGGEGWLSAEKIGRPLQSKKCSEATPGCVSHKDN